VNWLSIEYVSLDARRQTLFQKEVEDLRVVFGALQDCDVCVGEDLQPRVASRDHCSIERPDDFKLIYKAKNPVWLDGKLVTGTQSIFQGEVNEHWIWLGAMPPKDPPQVTLRERIDPNAVGLAGRGHFRCVLHEKREDVPPPIGRRGKGSGQTDARRLMAGQSGTNMRIYGIGALMVAGAFAAGAYLPPQLEAMRLEQERGRIALEDIDRQLKPILETAAFQERAGQSIYVVGGLLGDKFEPKGTAWVANVGGRPRLISNLHVGNQLKAAANDGLKIVARRTVAPGRVEDIALQPDYVGHPSYDAYQIVLESVRGVGNWPNVFDAAELVLAAEGDRSKLGPPLPIAPDIFELRALQFVGYIGFPMEGLSVTRFNPAEPEATSIVGKIQKVTDGFQRQLTPVEHRTLVQTDLKASGGASGSPLFDARGRVIGMVSGGDTISVVSPDGVVLRPSSGSFYAVRADVIEELGGRPPPADRETLWRCAVQQFGGGGGGCEGDVAGAPVASTTKVLGPDGAATLRIEGQPPGRYVLSAHAASPSLLRMKASWGDGRSTESDAASQEPNKPVLNLRLLATSDIELQLQGAAGDEFSWSIAPVVAGGAQ
jgi:hypothetical protein